MPYDPLRALPDEDHRLTVGIESFEVADFFAPTAESAEILSERRHWLTTAPHTYALLQPEAGDLVFALQKWANSWGIDQSPGESPSLTPVERLIEFGQRWEPDFVLMQKVPGGPAKTVGGCVCFPSSWRLADKLGLSLTDVHAVVPGLNAVLGLRLEKLLTGLKPGKGWFRSNWGLSASNERNQHLDRNLPALESPLRLDQVWFRREDQILAAIPESDGLVFGIRIEQIRGDTFVQSPEMARRLVRGLATLPDEILHYKRLLTVKEELLKLFSTTLS